MHALVHSNLHSEILSTQNIFLTYSLQSKRFLQKKHFQDIYEEFIKQPIPRYRISYLNPCREYIITDCHALLSDSISTMFFDKKVYIIHSQNDLCQVNKDSLAPITSLDNQLNDFIEGYKKTRIVKIIINIMRPYITDNLLIVLPKHNYWMHLSDFISILQNPLSSTRLSSNQIRFFKTLKSMKTSFPQICILNKNIRKMLSS